MKKQKFAIVLSGGGFKGEFQLGALNYLSEHWKQITGTSEPMRFDIHSGVSVGAAKLALIAQGQFDKLNTFWKETILKNGVSEVYTSDFFQTENGKLRAKLNVKAIVKKLVPELNFKLRAFEKLGLIFSKKKRDTLLQKILSETLKHISFPSFRAIADNSPFHSNLKALIDRSKMNGVYTCGFVSLNSGKYHSVKQNDFLSNGELIKGILASTSIPIIWQPVDSVKFKFNDSIIESKQNVDGGLLNITPLGDVIKLINQDPEDCNWKIFVINCHSGAPTQKDYSNKSIFQIAARSLYELTLGEIFNNDIQHFIEINRLVQQAKAWDYEIVLHNTLKQVIKQFDAVIINPQTEFDLGNPLATNTTLFNARYNHGYQMAQQLLKL